MTELSVPTHDPENLAFSINESLKSAEVLADPSYSHLRKSWRVRKDKNRIYLIKRVSIEKSPSSKQTNAAQVNEILIPSPKTDPFEVIQTILLHDFSDFGLDFFSISSLDDLDAFLEDYIYQFSEEGLKVKGKRDETG